MKQKEKSIDIIAKKEENSQIRETRFFPLAACTIIPYRYSMCSMNEIVHYSGANEKNQFVQSKIGKLVDTHFPIKTFTVKSTEDPWVTVWLKKKIKRSNTEYRKNG